MATSVNAATHKFEVGGLSCFVCGLNRMLINSISCETFTIIVQQKSSIYSFYRMIDNNIQHLSQDGVNQPLINSLKKLQESLKTTVQEMEDFFHSY